MLTNVHLCSFSRQTMIAWDKANSDPTIFIPIVSHFKKGTTLSSHLAYLVPKPTTQHNSAPEKTFHILRLDKCMSSNPVAEQANAANAVNTNNQAAGADAAQDDLFKMRTFDVFWVEKQALMYRDGFAKVRFNLLS